MEFPSRLLPLATCLAFVLSATGLSAAAPTLTSISTLGGGIEDSAFAVEFTILKAASDATSDPVEFRFKSLIAGTLKKGGANVNTNATLGTGETWTWAPPADANGVIDAFRVRAFANGEESATDIIVRVNVTAVNDTPSFTDANVSVAEDSGAFSRTNWATNISPGPTNESAQTTQFVITSNTNPGLFATAPALTDSGTLTFTPALNENGTATIGVKITDNGGTANGGDDESNVQTFTITVTAVPDAPVLAGAFKGTLANPFLDSTAVEGGPTTAYTIFDSLSITDPDQGKPSAASQTVTVTVANEAVALGNFVLPGSSETTSGSSKVYTLSGATPAATQSALRLATFTPFANAVPVGIHPFDVRVAVVDGDALAATPINSTAHLKSVNDLPTATVWLAVASITDAVPASPFRMSLNDPDLGETFSVTVTETTAVPLGTLPATPVTGTAAQVATGLQAISYVPNEQSANRVATFQVAVIDVHPDGSSGTPVPPATAGTPITYPLSLTVTFVNDSTQFSGITTNLIRTTDDPAAPPVYPFSSVSILDADPAQSLTITLSLDDPAKGGFAGDISPTNTITGTIAQITPKLRAIRFIPTSGRIPVNQSETATITLAVSDGTNTVSNSQTQVEVTAVDGAPNVRWDTLVANPPGLFPPSSAPALIDPSPVPKPFAKVQIKDTGEIEVTLTIDNLAKGTLANLGGFARVAPGSPSYRFRGSAAAAETAIQGIEYLIDPAYLFPPGQPGRTDFTITASDSALNFTNRLLPILLKSDSRSFLVTSVLDDETLPGTLRHAISVASNNDAIVFALPAYPATIRLNKAKGPLVLTKHLAFRGPGADKLTITGDSNANATTDPGDVQLFRVFASVQIQGLRLTRGFSDIGGAISVGRLQPSSLPGVLTLEDCIISNCLATQWGGAVDVSDATLKVARCVFEGNSLNASSGLGGGAVSLYTNQSCSFTNTTFSGNAQAAPTGFGGGALYVENDTPTRFVQTFITHCTFAANSDAAGNGSSLHNNVSNSRVVLANNIFGDFSARNLKVVGGAEILSSGGNLSNDNTNTTFIQGGVPQLAVLLNQASDKRNLDPRLAPIATLEGATRGHRLLPDSPAAGTGLPNLAATDQRGVIRNTSADSGALDANALGKLIVHEVFAATNPNQQFIEFYMPRDQAGIDFGGYEVWIDGTKRHTFAAPRVVNPGYGLILANAAITPATTATPVILATLALAPRGRIELRTPAASGGKVVEAVSYVAAFANSATPSVTVDYSLSSITLAPQFQGAAFAPHRLVQAPPNGGVLLAATGANSSPGADSGGTPFGEANAYPIATLDNFEVTEDEAATLAVLANDLDADGSDQRFVVDLNPALSAVPPATNKSAISTVPSGAAVTITPVAAPLRGTAIDFDPRVAFNHLPEGARFTESFAYSIVDVGGGAVAGYADGGGGTTKVNAPSHRLPAGALVGIRDAGPAAYNGNRVVTVVDQDHFTIPVAFAGNPDPLLRGRWQAAALRTPSARDEALVQVTVLGRNDPPTPAADSVATNEDTVLRIFGDPVAASPVLDTDALYPAPRSFAGSGILSNDSDPDTDGNPFTKLKLVGVCRANPITGFSGTPGASPVTVAAPAHGLQNGTTILISGYRGHPSYNGYHLATVTGPDAFTLPIPFVDNNATKGLWAVLDNSNRLATTSAKGASVTLEIRANRSQTNLIYNPRPSDFLDGLANGEPATDSFHYAVEDNHGAVSLALLSVVVAGQNNIPQVGDNPPGLAVLDPLQSGGATLPEILDGSEVLHLLPAAGSAGQVNVAIRPPGGAFGDVLVINGVDQTNEDLALNLASSDLLANDSDIDRSDTRWLEIGAGQNLSREGATISLNPGGTTLTYNPTAAPKLQALAFKERVVDTFVITVTDGIARVDNLVAVLVEGRNDSPFASNATFTTPEKTFLEVKPPGLLLSGLDLDQNTALPDNRKFLLPTQDFATTVFGAKVSVLLEPRTGSIDLFGPLSGTPGVTVVTAPGHRLQSGEEVVLLGSGKLTGQFVLTRLSDNTFSVPVAFDPAFASIGGATWRTLASTFHYDPRGSVFSGPTGGPAFTLQGLAQGQSHTDTFTYTLLDGSFLFANDDIYRIEADRSDIELHVLGNDTGLDGVATSRRIVEVGPPSAGGTVVMNGDQSLVYTPQTGFVGDEVFTYTIEDDLGNRDRAMVTARVTIDRLNGNLRANDDHFTVAAGQTPLVDVLANDNIIPATGDPLAIDAISTDPDEGGEAVIESGRIRYTPNPLITVFPYTETFEYTMSGGGVATATARVSILVVDRRGDLNVRDDSFSVPAGSVANTLNVLENDNILPGNGDALEIVAKTTPAHGTLSILYGVALTYTPDPGFLGSETFSYSVQDGLGGTATAQVTVKVGYLTTNSDIFSVRFDDPGKTDDNGLSTLDVLANDNVLQGGGGQLTITAVSPASAALGTVAIATGGTSLDFNPAPGATGQQNFTYTVTDAGGRSATNTVTVVVVAAGIRASSDFFTVQADSQSTELTVLSNDIRISELPGELSIAAIGTGLNAPDQGGTVEVSPDFKKILYTPATGFRGVESFTYTVTDGDSMDTARVSVRSTDGAMVAGDDAFLAFRGSSENRMPVLANDLVIPDGGQLLFVTAVGLDPANLSNPPNRGTLEIIEDGAALRYTPSAANPPGSYVETFTYEISAGGTERSAARIRIEVLNRAGARDLETNHDRFAVRSDSSGTLLPVLANDSVLPASAAGWIITEVTAPANGAVQISGDQLLYAPLPGFVGTEVFTYKVSDGFGGTGQADVTVKVGDISVSDDAFTVIAGGGAVALDVTANDGILRTSFPATPLPSQADFTLTTARPITLDPASAGSAVVAGDQLSYTPDSAFTGVATLTYWVRDDSGNEYPGIARIDQRAAGEDRDTAVASITVTGINDPPQLLGVGPTATSDTNPLQPFANATVVEFDEQRQQLVTLTITYPAGQGVLGGGFTVISPGVLRFQGTAAQVTAALRALVFTPVPNRIPIGQTENTVFTLSLDDGFVASPVIIAPAVTTVTPVNDLPVITGTVALQKLYQFSSLRPFAGVNITDIDELGLQPQTYSVRIDNAIKGALSNFAGFVQQPAGSGIYLFTGPPAAAATALRGLLFTPTPGNRVTPVSPEVAGFTITITDGFGPPVVDAVTSVQILHGEVDRLLSLGTTGLDVSQTAAAFGTAVAISGDTLVVGSPLRDLPAVDAGRVFVYERNAGFGAPWGQVAQVAGSDTVAGDRFGESVSIDGNFMVVGAPGADAAASNAGAAYVFQRNPGNPNAWTQVAKLLPPLTNGAGNDAFGTAVAIQGNTILAGAPNANLPGAPRSGRVFAYRSAAGVWSHVQTLVAADNRTTGIAGDNEDFGFSLAFDGNTAVIGSHGANLGGQTSQWNYGAAYIFTRGGSELPWAEIKRLDEFADPTATSNSGFGYAVDIAGDRIVVGVHSGNSPFGVFKPGGARIYERDFNGVNQWGEVKRISPADGIPSDYFATSVAISGDLVLIGSPGPGQASTVVRGYMEVHRRASSPVWSLIDRLPPGADTAFDRFGQAVAIDGFTGVSGAPGDSVNLLGVATAGSSRVYQFQYDLGPRLALPVPDQLARQDTPFQFAVNPATFNDPIYPGPLTLSVALSNGSPLPAGAWLTFNPVTATFAGTPVAANRGDYMLVLTATNPLGSKRVSNPFLISVSGGGLDSAYAAWAAGQFTPAELANPALEASVWGMNANPEGDSQSNLLEMLFGLNPKLSDQADLVFTRLSSTLSTLNFPRSTAFPADQAEVEWSTDLLTWSTTGVGLTPAAAVGGIERVTAVITSPVPRTRLFVRVVAGE